MMDFSNISPFVNGQRMLKMQKIIKGTGPSVQHFETVNFAFMKFFDVLVKIPFFGGLSAFIG